MGGAHFCPLCDIMDFAFGLRWRESPARPNRNIFYAWPSFLAGQGFDKAPRQMYRPRLKNKGIRIW